jgi:hypothetical protein
LTSCDLVKKLQLKRYVAPLKNATRQMLRFCIRTEVSITSLGVFYNFT